MKISRIIILAETVFVLLFSLISCAKQGAGLQKEDTLDRVRKTG